MSALACPECGSVDRDIHCNVIVRAEGVHGFNLAATDENEIDNCTFSEASDDLQ